MKRVLTAVVLVPLVLLVVFRAPLMLFAVVIGVIVLLTLHEYLGVVEKYDIKPVRWAAYGLSILMVIWIFLQISVRYAAVRQWVSYLWPEEALYWSILLLIPFIFGVPVVFRRDLRMALAGSAASAFGVLYIAIPLTLLIAIRFQWRQRILLVFVLLTVWIGDTAAYYVGRAVGRHKLAPIVSPNKTWEGAIASLASSILVAWLVFHFQTKIDALFPELPATFYTPLLVPDRQTMWMHIVILALLTNIAAQFGDLFESALKRGAQVKDSGTLLPGHGGLLDRIDALLCASPPAGSSASVTRVMFLDYR